MHEDEFIIVAFRGLCTLLQRLAWEIHPPKQKNFIYMFSIYKCPKALFTYFHKLSTFHKTVDVPQR